jgi:hypothetical protein
VAYLEPAPEDQIAHLVLHAQLQHAHLATGRVLVRDLGRSWDSSRAPYGTRSWTRPASASSPAATRTAATTCSC